MQITFFNLIIINYANNEETLKKPENYIMKRKPMKYGLYFEQQVEYECDTKELRIVCNAI